MTSTLEYYFLFLMVLFMPVELVNGGATVTVGLLSYRYESRQDCDGFIGDYKCDPFFKVCLQSANASCAGDQVRTSYVNDKNAMADILHNNETTPNPIKFRFKKLAVPLTVVVEIWNKNFRRDQFLDNATVVVPADNPIGIHNHPLVVNTHTVASVGFYVNVSCDANHYGPDCSKYCFPVINFVCNINGVLVCQNRLLSRTCPSSKTPPTPSTTPTTTSTTTTTPTITSTTTTTMPTTTSTTTMPTTTSTTAMPTTTSTTAMPTTTSTTAMPTTTSTTAMPTTTSTTAMPTTTSTTAMPTTTSTTAMPTTTSTTAMPTTTSTTTMPTTTTPTTTSITPTIPTTTSTTTIMPTTSTTPPTTSTTTIMPTTSTTPPITSTTTSTTTSETTTTPTTTSTIPTTTTMATVSSLNPKSVKHETTLTPTSARMTRSTFKHKSIAPIMSSTTPLQQSSVTPTTTSTIPTTTTMATVSSLKPKSVKHETTLTPTSARMTRSTFKHKSIAPIMSSTTPLQQSSVTPSPTSIPTTSSSKSLIHSTTPTIKSPNSTSHTQSVSVSDTTHPATSVKKNITHNYNTNTHTNAGTTKRTMTTKAVTKVAVQTVSVTQVRVSTDKIDNGGRHVGAVNQDDQSKSKTLPIALGVSAGVILVVGVAVLVMFMKRRQKPTQVILDDDALADDGRMAFGGSLQLRLDHIDNTTASRNQESVGIENPTYGTV